MHAELTSAGSLRLQHFMQKSEQHRHHHRVAHTARTLISPATAAMGFLPWQGPGKPVCLMTFSVFVVFTDRARS